MKNFNLHQRIKRLDNNNGLAIVIVILVFVFLSFLTTTVVAMVYSDNVFSQVDENQKKSYYAARSAITIVEAAIKEQLDELQSLKNVVESRASAHNSNPSDETRANWETAKSNYEAKLDYVRGTVLPTSSIMDLRHNVEIDTADFDTATDSFIVNIHYISDEEFRLESKAIVDEQEKTVVRLLNIEDEVGVSSINLSQIIGVFDNAVWVGNDFVAHNNTTINGDVSYGNKFDTYNNFKFGHGGKKKKRTDYVNMPEPDDFIREISGYAGVPDNLPIKTKKDFNNLNGIINSSANGKYPEISTKNKNLTFKASNGDLVVSFNKLKAEGNTFNIDAEDGNVILKFGTLTTQNNTTINIDTKGNDVIIESDYLTMENNTDFNIKGGGSLIFYVKESMEISNKTEFKCKEGSEVYIILEKNLTKENSFVCDNGMYIYAPNSDIGTQNNFNMTGAIIAKNIDTSNKTTITYRAPGRNIQVAETNEGGTILSLETHSLSLGQNSRWLKE